MQFSFTIVADQCEGCGECIPFCPGECIHWADRKNTKGTNYVFIDARKCINCYACCSGCPVTGAILDRWAPQYQKAPSIARTYGGFREAWRTEAVLACANRLHAENSPDSLTALAVALEAAGCADQKLLNYCRSCAPASGRRWLADLILDMEPLVLQKGGS